MEEDLFSGALPADADRYVLVVRWGLILAAGLIYAMMKTPPPAYLNPILVLAGVAAYSLPISVYAFQKYPLTRGRPWWLLASDTACATAAVVLTGGHTSAFYLLFLLVLIEIALAYRWRVAMTLAVLVDALQLAASMASNGGAINAFVVVNRFVALLVFGVFAILFGENARREEAERRRMAVASAYERRLNQIFLKLGESSMDLERMLGVILESAQRFLGASYAVVLLRDEASAALRVAASSAPPYPVGQDVTVDGRKVHLTGTEYRLLELLARNAGRVMPTESLLARLWGPAMSDNPDYLKVYIHRLRTKLGDDPANPRYIHTERGVGYWLAKG